MLKPLLLTLFVLLVFINFGQTHSYSFSGSLNNGDITNLEKGLSSLPFINKSRVSYKSEKNQGEILLFIQNDDIKGENLPTWSPVDIKSLLISYGLEPLEFKTFDK